MSLAVATAPHFQGPYQVAGNEPVFGVGRGGEMEDPFIWKDAGGFHMVATDQRGGVIGEKHGGVLAHSADGLRWQLDRSPKAYSKTLTWTDGSVRTQGQLERPFGLFQNGVLTHFFFGTMDGPGGFQNGTRSWNMVVRVKPER